MRRRIEGFSTGTLEGMRRWLERLPPNVMGELREAVSTELLAREMAAIAEQSGGHPCCGVWGVQ